MAQQIRIGGASDVFIGTDLTLKFQIFGVASDDTAAAKLAMQKYQETGAVPSDFDTLWTPTNMAGWALTFDVRVTDTATTALISKTATITGTYSATRTSNTQRAEVALTDDDLIATTIKATVYRYSLKRTDAGFETILLYGDFTPERVTQT